VATYGLFDLQSRFGGGFVICGKQIVGNMVGPPAYRTGREQDKWMIIMSRDSTHHNNNNNYTDSRYAASTSSWNITFKD